MLFQPGYAVLPLYERTGGLPSLKPGDVLSKYSLTEEVAARYVHSITYRNQTETAEDLDVSRDTVNRYKNSFAEMTAEERLLLISAFAQDQLLDQVTSEQQ